MDIEGQLRARNQFRLEESNLYYTAATGIHNEKHMQALKIPHLGIRQYLFQQSGYPWDGDTINLRVALVGITSPPVWSSISPSACPVRFTQEEKESAIRESAEWNDSERALSDLRGHLGIDLEGGTGPENFEFAAHRNTELRMEITRQAAEGEREKCWRNWPFKDDDDTIFPPSTN